MRVSKPFSQSRITHQAAGQAMRLAITTGLRELPGEEPDDVAHARPEDLADPDLLGAPLGGEGGQPEQAEAGDEYRQPGEAREGLPARLVGAVKLGEPALGEIGFERDGAGVAAPDLLGAGADLLRLGPLRSGRRASGNSRCRDRSAPPPARAPNGSGCSG
jgi:hypothetical protein